jgi:hypothetical protein
MECEKCNEMTTWYLKEHPEKKGYVLCQICYEKSKEYFVYLNLPYQPERSKREDLCEHSFMRQEKMDKNLSTPFCEKCGVVQDAVL